MSKQNADIPEGYRMTELGPLPKEWRMTALGQMATLVTDKTEPSEATGLPYIGLEHIDTGDPILKRSGTPSEVRSTKSVFCQGDILYGKLRPYLDKVVLAPTDGVCSTDILILRANVEHCDSQYLLYALHTGHFLQHAISTTTGTNHPRTSWAKIKSFEFALPSLPEQKEIAAVLSIVRLAKDKTEGVIASLRVLKMSLLKHLFIYGTVPVDEAGEVELKETEIGEMPKEWTMSTLGAEGKFQYGYTASATEQNTGTQFLRITDIRDDGRVDWSGVPFAPVDNISMERYGLNPGEILFARIGATTGKTCIIYSDCPKAIFASYLIRLKVGSHLDPQYTFYYTNTEQYWRLVQAGKEGKLKKGLNSQQLKNFPVPIPPLHVQTEIAKRLLAVDAKLAELENETRALEDLFQTLLHDLMIAKIRVNDLEVPA